MRLAPHPVSLRQFQYLVALADLRSFRQAAQACHVSQPSLSAQVAQVEDLLGVKLFERDRRRVLPTEAGAALVERARALLVQADAWFDAAERLDDPLSGTLKLGVIPSVGPYLLPEVTQALRTRFPRLSFLWREDKTTELARQLNAGELDGAVVAAVGEVKAFARGVIGQDAFVLATPLGHPLGAAAAPAKAEELHGAPMLLLDEGHCFREQALSFCARARAEELGFRATSLGTLAQMVAGGAGVTLLPRLALPVENRRGELLLRKLVPSPSRSLVLVWRHGAARAPALLAVASALREEYARLEPRLQAAEASAAKAPRRKAR
jgi:LysR family hydrogen peroxide-inducible transcriptional activator